MKGGTILSSFITPTRQHGTHIKLAHKHTTIKTYRIKITFNIFVSFACSKIYSPVTYGKAMFQTVLTTDSGRTARFYIFYSLAFKYVC